ncbi:hypothetical protein [Haloferula sp. BvORR071]|uniref:hypothetical protein n=1 Tax=Haloferula sp. BvORR071 TaxID=1396141 RepID=UPI002240ED9E|nr:hypothetical protein [Haloferula sp. BvORR071]
METHRSLIAAATLFASAAAAHADIVMLLSADKLFYQTSPLTARFERGNLNVLLRDGLVILDGACVVDPQLFFFPPSNIPPCPLGATGFVASGDVDRDGVRDDNQYWSVSGVIPALVVEPGRPELCLLYSAPPSKMPRPLANFRDDSVITFFDISTALVVQYDQSRYELNRPYGSVRQVETVQALGNVNLPGTMTATVTGVDIVGSPLVITYNVEAGLVGSQWAENLRSALASNAAVNSVYAIGGLGSAVTLTERVANGNDTTLNVALDVGTALVDGMPVPTSINTTQGSTAPNEAALKQMNEEIIPGTYVFTYPRLGTPDLNPVAIPVTIVPNLEAVTLAGRTRGGFRFTSGTWRKDVYQMDPRTINKIRWVGNDRTVVRPGDLIFFSILNESEERLLFPPTVPQNPVFLPTPTAQQYTLPPFFFDVGQKGVMDLEYQRNLFSSGISGDFSSRNFRAKVEFVDSFTGYAQIALPAGTVKRDLTPFGNVDHDSMTNVEEFAYQFPTNEDIQASAREQFQSRTTDPSAPALGLVALFNKVTTKVPNEIIDPDAQPTGPAAPFLDADNHVVFEVPLRPRTGNTLKYAFFQAVEGKKKGVKLKIGTDWEMTTRTETITKDVNIELKVVDTADGSTVALVPRPAPLTTITLTREFTVLRSVNPVADPSAPLPDLRVVVAAVTLK